MLADLLNNSGCQERLAACNILPLLQGTISKDMCSKLVVLVWEDWNPEIRDAAAKALGKTAHGKVCKCFHYPLIQRVLLLVSSVHT